jgi:hypothetical protein
MISRSRVRPAWLCFKVLTKLVDGRDSLILCGDITQSSFRDSFRPLANSYYPVIFCCLNYQAWDCLGNVDNDGATDSTLSNFAFK